MSIALEDRMVNALARAFELEDAGEIEESIRMFKLASKLGSNDARSKLGTIYDDVVKPAKPGRAVYWYKQGVKRGMAACAWNLAMHYAGQGRRRGYLYWLRIAETMGDSDALEELGSGNWWKKTNPVERKGHVGRI